MKRPMEKNGETMILWGIRYSESDSIDPITASLANLFLLMRSLDCFPSFKRLGLNILINALNGQNRPLPALNRVIVDPLTMINAMVQ